MPPITNSLASASWARDIVDLIDVCRYTPNRADAWNAFVVQAKNATFLFDRRFMDYHSDRFTDNSLIFSQDGIVIALLPANLSGSTLVSHGGLTYGGIVTDARMSAGKMLEVFDACLTHLRSEDIRTFIYKPVPHFYHLLPAEEDIYALYRFGAKLTQVDASAAIAIASRPRFSNSRRMGVKRARKAGLRVQESADWVLCWALLESVLAERHGTTPTHGRLEIERLAAAFPDRIRQFGAYLGDEMVSAIVVFDCVRTVHVQYIASGSKGRELGGVDLIVQHLLDDVFRDRCWLDLGISTEAGGAVLNAGLANQKEMFGARTVVYQRFSVDI
jgi:hypothetical protein